MWAGRVNQVATGLPGSAITSVPYVSGVVTGVASFDDGILLAVGDLYVDLNDVIAVRQPLQSTDPDA